MTQQTFIPTRAMPPQAVCLINALERHGRAWVPAKHLESITGMDKRQLRRAAKDSKGEVLSGPGSQGYSLTRHHSMEEVRAITNKIQSQAKRMISHSIDILRTAHGR